MVARWLLLFVAAAFVGSALGATERETSASGARLVLAAAVAWLAPMCWPGLGTTPAGTARRVLSWSAGAALLAAALMVWLGAARQEPEAVARTAAMLLVILLLSHALAAGLEGLLRRRAADGTGAREAAGRSTTWVLTAVAALPLWLGPLAQGLAGSSAWLVDGVLGLSPLTHLALASGNDLLRNEWLYQHANLASLQTTYPELSAVAWSYTTAGAVVLAAAIGLAHRPQVLASRMEPTSEKTS